MTTTQVILLAIILLILVVNIALLYIKAKSHDQNINALINGHNENLDKIYELRDKLKQEGSDEN